MDLHLVVGDKNSGFFSDGTFGFLEHVLWVGLAIFALLWVGRPILQALAGRIQEVGVAGLSIKLSERVEDVSESKGIEILFSEASLVARRLEKSAYLLKDAKILWVDDAPDNNRLERRILESLGAKIDCVLSTVDGARLDLLFDYDLIISDMARGESLSAGAELAQLIARRESPTPVILYVGTPRPVPANVFGITVRPDELFHLILDVLGRNRS